MNTWDWDDIPLEKQPQQGLTHEQWTSWYEESVPGWGSESSNEQPDEDFEHERSVGCDKCKLADWEWGREPHHDEGQWWKEEAPGDDFQFKYNEEDVKMPHEEEEPADDMWAMMLPLVSEWWYVSRICKRRGANVQLKPSWKKVAHTRLISFRRVQIDARYPPIKPQWTSKDETPGTSEDEGSNRDISSDNT